jgi:RNA polymerase sigma-54 factor
MIKDLVEAEDKKNPLSDSEIKDSLVKSGVKISRRTVAKYRETLKILPVSKRREK